ncbi:MAG: hypothetical protein LBV19_10615 [Streptococcaceae bacterium]|nr:hypothetical protein [Streptococcaceae bacterium]
MKILASVLSLLERWSGRLKDIIKKYDGKGDGNSGETEKANLALSNELSVKEEQAMYELTAELSEYSYEMELKREKRIDSRFERLITSVSLILVALGFFTNQDSLRQVVDLKSLIWVILILCAVLILSLVGNFYWKSKYILAGEKLKADLETKIVEFTNSDRANLEIIHQFSTAQESLERNSNMRRCILFLANWMLILSVVKIIFILLNAIKIIEVSVE